MDQIVFKKQAVDAWIETVMLTIDLSGLQGRGLKIVSNECVKLCDDGRVLLYIEIGKTLIAEYYVARHDWAWIV